MLYVRDHKLRTTDPFEKEDAKSGAPFVRGYQTLDWLVRDEIFKLAFGTDSDMLLDASIRKEEPFPWID